MKLLTHNMLTSKCLKGVVTGYPLKVEASEVKNVDVPFNEEFTKRLLSKIDYDVFKETALSLNIAVPDKREPKDWDEEYLFVVHNTLLGVEVITGDLICPETGRKFPIKNGIPNMLCNEDEV